MMSMVSSVAQTSSAIVVTLRRFGLHETPDHCHLTKELAHRSRRFFDVPWLEEGIDVVKTSVQRLSQFGEALSFVTEFETPAVDRAFAQAVADELRANGTPLDGEGYHAMVDRLKGATGLKGKNLFMPLRLAITGRDHGPELVKVIPLLERASQSDARVLSPLARLERILAAAG